MFFREICTVNFDDKILKARFFDNTVYILTKRGINKVNISEKKGVTEELIKLPAINVKDFDIIGKKIVIAGENQVTVRKLEDSETILESYELKVKKIGKVVCGNGDVIPLLGEKPILISKGKIKILEVPVEHVFDLIICDINRDDAPEIILQGLWGLHILDHLGNMQASKTFGDIIVGINTCHIGEETKLIIGTKNGTMFILDEKLDIENDINLNKPLKFFTACCHFRNVLIWSSFEPRIELTEIRERITDTYKLIETQDECENVQCYQYKDKTFTLIKCEKKIILGEIIENT